jgi:hypothetical protein
MALKRFLNGISDVPSANPLGQFPYSDPTQWRVFYEDWTVYDLAQTDTPEWTYTISGAGTDTIVTPGKLVFTAVNASDDYQLQLDHGHFFLVANKKAIFETKIKIVKGGGTIGQEGFVVGLTSVQVAAAFMDGPPPTARAFDDGWGFLSYDATTDIVCFQGEADTFSTEVGVATYADDTYMVLSVYWDGTKSTFYKDDVEICQITSNPPVSVITPCIFFGTGEAQADAFHCDYIFAATER